MVLIMSALGKIEGFGISGAGFVFAIAAGVLFGASITFPDLMLPVLGWLFASAPAWLPILLSIAFWNLWIHYRRAQFISSQDMMLIEVKIPRDIDKSPRAMELIFAGIALSSGESTFINRWIEGSVRPWFSFELVSDGGRIHFYIWIRRKVREIVEAQIYAQYPNVEIYESEDYASRLPWDPDRYSGWGCDFMLTNKDPYPIKTYIDYELDQNPKEEYKIDPIAHLLEFLSSLKPGEQAWYQIMIRVSKDTRVKHGHWFKREDRWRADAEDEIQAIKIKATPMRKDKEGNEVPGFVSLTPMQTDQIKAIQRSIDKTAFDTGIRGLYVAEKNAFRAVAIGGLTGVFRQFSSSQFNGIRPTRWMTSFDYPWQDIGGVFKARTLRRLFDAYRRRSWFHPPYVTPYFVMTSEELATIYHFPSRTVQAPGLDRIPARKFEAPPNLPTA